MRLFLTALLLAGTLAEQARGQAPAAAQAHPPIEFHGNVLFNDFVYRSILELPKDTRPSLDTARSVARRIARFLHDAGYDLATVRARVEGDHVRVDVSEGVLDKVLILGEGAFETLRLKLELGLPFDVFNRPLLEQQLQKLARRFQLQDFAYELVPVEGKKEAKLQLDEMEALQALPFVKPGRPYELRIFVQPSGWGTGASPDLYVGGIEGLGLGLHYQSKELLIPDDRWDVGGRVGGAIRQHLDSQDARPVLTRALAFATWFAPPLLAEGFRPAFAVSADLISYQRPDLHLDGYNQLTLAMGLGARDRILPELEISFGLGIERRLLLNVDSIGPPAPQVDAAPRAETRPLAAASVRITLNPDELRRDRRHALDLDARLYGSSSPDRPMTLRLLGGYQKMFAFGWNELWIEGKGALLAGDVLFSDERSIGEDLHGPFGSVEFARKLVGLSLEFRYSLLRDLFKLGVFHDAVGYGQIDRTVAAMGTERLRGANAAGLGLHWLVFDELQIDGYYGFGWTTDGKSDRGLSVAIRQAY